MLESSVIVLAIARQHLRSEWMEAVRTADVGDLTKPQITFNVHGGDSGHTHGANRIPCPIRIVTMRKPGNSSGAHSERSIPLRHDSGMFPFAQFHISTKNGDRPTIIQIPAKQGCDATVTPQPWLLLSFTIHYSLFTATQ